MTVGDIILVTLYRNRWAGEKKNHFRRDGTLFRQLWNVVVVERCTVDTQHRTTSDSS